MWFKIKPTSQVRMKNFSVETEVASKTLHSWLLSIKQTYLFLTLQSGSSKLLLNYVPLLKYDKLWTLYGKYVKERLNFYTVGSV